MGRYAYGNQPGIAHWNLARLAECLLPLISEDEEKALELARGALAGFAPRFGAAWREGMLAKLGLAAEEDDDEALVEDLFTLMAEGGADFTLTFRHLCDAAEGDDAPLRALFAEPAAVEPWLARWRARLAREGGARAAAMRAVNPLYIPRNHLVEEAIAAAVRRDDLAPFEALLSVLERPFEAQPGRERYATPPRPEERVLRTFCGT